jgi:hypothetical protein
MFTKNLKYNNLILFILFSVLVASCDLVKVKDEGVGIEEQSKAIARANDHYLYASDLDGIVPTDASVQDSTNRMAAYVNNWIRKQLLIDEASARIDFDEAEIQRKILEYRYSLIAYGYKSYYVNENLTKEVSEEEIESYYQDNQQNFPLKQNIIRGKFIRVPKDSPNRPQIKGLLNSTREDKMEELKTYCFSYALMYSLEDSVWINFDDIIKNTPLAEIPNKVDFLKRTKYTESSDETSNYYLLIKEYKKTDDIAPLEIVRDQIVGIIINKRKVALARNLEKEVYDKAVETNAFEIY